MIQHAHLGVYLVARDDRGCLLTIRKQRGPYAGTYDLPGGTPDHGETHLTTVQRELREETGLDLATDDLVFLTATSMVHGYHRRDDGEPASLHHHALLFGLRGALPTGHQDHAGDALDSGGTALMPCNDPTLSPLAAHAVALLGWR